MNWSINEALDRTLLLLRDEIADTASDEQLLDALTRTRVVIAADRDNLASHASQCAFATTVLLMARSGHRVHLIGPDACANTALSPVSAGGLVQEILTLDRQILPLSQLSGELPKEGVDLQILIGSTAPVVIAARTLWLSATDWSGRIDHACTKETISAVLPMGAFAAAAMAATEAFKLSVTPLRIHAKSVDRFDQQFAAVAAHEYKLGGGSCPEDLNLGEVSVVSAGAITHALLYCLCRIPGVRGTLRVYDDDAIGLSNANRYMLMRLSDVGTPKVTQLRDAPLGRLRVVTVERRFGNGDETQGGVMLVGCDDIPSRWRAQESNPDWLCVGATTHWCAMASYHEREGACARCLHPRDDANQGPIPTVAFVSFWAGLLQVSYLLRYACRSRISAQEQQTYLCPLRPERPWVSPVAISEACPNSHQARQ